MDILQKQKTKFKSELTDLTQSLETPWGKFSFIEDTTKIDPDFPNYELKYVTVPIKSRMEQYVQAVNISLSNKKANAISINIEGNNIKKNEAIINKIIELYERDALNDKNKTARQLSSFIDSRIELLTIELFDIENNIEIDYSIFSILLYNVFDKKEGNNIPVGVNFIFMLK